MTLFFTLFFSFARTRTSFPGLSLAAINSITAANPPRDHYFKNESQQSKLGREESCEYSFSNSCSPKWTQRKRLWTSGERSRSPRQKSRKPRWSAKKQVRQAEFGWNYSLLVLKSKKLNPVYPERVRGKRENRRSFKKKCKQFRLVKNILHRKVKVRGGEQYVRVA